MKGNILIVGSPDGLEQLCPLVRMGWKLFSTRNNVKFFESRGVKCNLVEITEGCPRRLAGHPVPNTHLIAGIMADRSSIGDMEDIEDLEIDLIDIVIIDPSRSFSRQLDGKQPFDIGSIDVEPSILIFSAIQNSRWVTPVTSLKDRECVVREISKDGEVSELTKKVLTSNALAWLSSNTKFLSEIVHYQIGKKQPIYTERFPVS